MVNDVTTRKLAAIISADVKEYSRLMSQDERGTVRTLNEYKDAMSKLIQEYKGCVLDAVGDNLLAEFGSVVDAVNCAVEIQRELAERNADLPRARQMEFRIGINLGDIIVEEKRIYGDGVNIAARVEGLAEGGGICISGTAYDHVEGKIGLEYEYLGEQEVKNIEKPVRVYRVLSFPGAAAHRVVKARSAMKKRWRNISLTALGIVLVIGIALSIWHFYFRPPPIEPASLDKMAFPLPDKPSIAVLPFTNMSGDSEQEYFCDGITDQIITTLSIVPRLFVIARNSTFTYKGKAVKVQQVAEELGVRYVLEGSVQRSEERIRILVQLIDATTGLHLWSERYDRDLKDLFALQDEIAMEIMTILQVKLTEGEYARVLAGGTSNLQAMESFWRAEERFFRFSKEDNAEARRWVEKAIELDPNFAGAWALKGYTHMQDVAFGFSKSPVQSIKRAEECAQKAIALDDSNAKAFSLLGRLCCMQRKFDQAIEYGEKAVALSPNDPHMLASFSQTLHSNGRFEESIGLIKKAMRLSPYYPAFYLQFLARSYVLSERYEEAIATSKLLLGRSQKGEFNPLFAHLYLAEAFIGLGQEDNARSQAEEVLKINPNFSLKSYPFLYSYRDPNYSERRVAALSKAGLPETPPLPIPDKPSIAVLPFVNMSDDPGQEYFSDGITEEIITALCKTPKLFVIARTSSFRYKGKEVDVRTVGRELGVRYVLEGSVRRSEDQLRITAQLVDTKTGNHLWAERYDRGLKDIFALQDEITFKVITALQVKLTEGEQALIFATGTDNFEAYAKFLKGMGYASRLNREGNFLARKMAEEVIALDPGYPQGYRLLAGTHMMDVWFGLSKSPRKSLAEAVRLYQKAIDMHPSAAAVTRGLLGIVYTMMRQHEKGIAELEKAIALNPNVADNHAFFGFVLHLNGRQKEALVEIKKAIRLNPFPENIYFLYLGHAYMYEEMYDESISAYKKALRIQPNNLFTRLRLAAAYSLLGREDAAHAEAAEVLRINPKFSLERFAKTVPFKNQADTEHLINALRKAGLK